MKGQKAKMKGNEGPKGQKERKWRPNRRIWRKCIFVPGRGRDNPGHTTPGHPGTRSRGPPRDTPGHAPGTPRDNLYLWRPGGPETWSGTRALKEDKNTKPMGKELVVRRCVGGATGPRFGDFGHPGLGRVGRRILSLPASRFTNIRA